MMLKTNDCKVFTIVKGKNKTKDCFLYSDWKWLFYKGTEPEKEIKILLNDAAFLGPKHHF